MFISFPQGRRHAVVCPSCSRPHLLEGQTGFLELGVFGLRFDKYGLAGPRGSSWCSQVGLASLMGPALEAPFVSASRLGCVLLIIKSF